MNPISLSHTVEYYSDSLASWKQEGNVFSFHSRNGVILAVHVLSDQIIRFRYTTDGFFMPDFSYAIEDEVNTGTSFLRSRDGKNRVTITTSKVVCKIEKENLAVQIWDRSGNIILEDEKGFHWRHDHIGGNIVMMSKKAVGEEQYFGLGDKTCSLNLRGKRLQNWCSDCFGYGSETDPLYRSIPFYSGLREGIGYGVFFDNSFRTHFDFAAERNEVTSFWAQGGEMNYYFFYGPDLLEVSRQYTRMTGTPEMPPLWAFGYHQCRWSYYPESRLRKIAKEFRDRSIPCDALYLDIDYMDGYRCFTWNKKHFPQPRKMIKELEDTGFKTVVIIDPGIKVDLDNDICKEGIEKGYFLKRQDGPFVKGRVWPGECFFPDFTSPDVREWWAKLYRDLIRKDGVKGVWNDMNEPATFDLEGRTLYDDVRHDYDGHSCSHRKAHNVYGMQMSRASYEGVKRFSYPNRPFLITRATYAGGQRYASAWTGDNISSWEHLRLANIQSQRMAVSGFSFIGSDVGGFNDLADGELLVRWLQLGAFHPLFRNHTMGNNVDGAADIDDEAVEEKALQYFTDQEPWAFGEDYEIPARKAIEFRYQILPIIYTAFWQYVKEGSPFLRPLAFIDQGNPDTYYRMEEFCVGDHLLVCPISEPGVTGRSMYLPEGNWYNFFTDELVEGSQEIWVDAGLDQIPLFIRAGAMLPMYPIRQYVGERPIEEVFFHVYYTDGDPVSSFQYEDEGEGYAYEDGEFLLKKVKVSGDSQHLRIQQNQEGAFVPTYGTCKLIIHGLPFHPNRLEINGDLQPIPSNCFKENRLEIDLIQDFKEVVFRV